MKVSQHIRSVAQGHSARRDTLSRRSGRNGNGERHRLTQDGRIQIAGQRRIAGNRVYRLIQRLRRAGGVVLIAGVRRRDGGLSGRNVGQRESCQVDAGTIDYRARYGPGSQHVGIGAHVVGEGHRAGRAQRTVR